MKALLLALVIVAGSAHALTQNEDGTVTMTKQEYANMTTAFENMTQESYRNTATAEGLRNLLEQVKEALSTATCI